MESIVNPSGGAELPPGDARSGSPDTALPPTAAAVPLPAILYATRRRGYPRLIVGRTIATMGFFEAYLRATVPAVVTAYVADEATLAEMREHARAIGCDPARLVGVMLGNSAALAACGSLLCPTPTMVAEAARRGDPRAYSLIGVTHSLSSREVWRDIMDYPTAPLQPWDALVCTSQAARTVVDQLLDAADEGARRAGATAPVPRPVRPIIPLGVDAAAFATDAAKRAAWRQRYAIAEADVVVLFLGRLSLHAKAHPFALVAACAEAAGELATAGRTAARLRLVFAGQFANQPIADAFRGLVERFASGLPTTFIDSPSDSERGEALAGADIFASFADSIQETFGLAPVEAMAAGLPVVVTDWNGYRDTVRDGVEGFLVRTLMAPPPAATSALLAYVQNKIEYDRFCGVLGQLVAVDVPGAAAAIGRLAGDAALRRQMGAAGMARVRATYDWAVVMAEWRQLWTALAERRQADAPARPVAIPRQVPPDPLAALRRLRDPLPRADRPADAAPGGRARRHRRSLRDAGLPLCLRQPAPQGGPRPAHRHAGRHARRRSCGLAARHSQRRRCRDAARPALPRQARPADGDTGKRLSCPEARARPLRQPTRRAVSSTNPPKASSKPREMAI